MKINSSPKPGITQAVLHTFNTKIQNTKIATTIYSNYIVAFFYYVYKFNLWRSSGIRVFKYIYNHIQPPYAAYFCHGERNS